LGFISDVLTASLAEERANFRAEKRKCGKTGSCSKNHGPGRISEATFSWQLSAALVKAQGRVVTIDSTETAHSQAAAQRVVPKGDQDGASAARLERHSETEAGPWPDS
jgi:hypothetical protein